MTPDPLNESLSKLDDRYQILTELHHCGESRTYLARNLELNRDVTITVARAAGDKAFLNAYAADAEILRTKRHPNLIPVLEGMWLDDGTYAVVRARVRGSTLEQTVRDLGTMPPARIAAALGELTTALVWARGVGITNRCIEPETFVFQQGNDRVLIGFEPSPLIAGDAETIAALARMMNGGAYLDVSEYTARLGAPAVTSTPGAAAAVAAAGVVTSANGERMTDKQVGVPVGSDAAVVERPNRGMSFMARVLTTFTVIAAIVVGAILLMHHRRDEARLSASTQSSDTSNAAGDVALHNATDTAAAYGAAYPTPQIVSAAPSQAPPNLDSIGRENEKRIAEAKEQARAMAATYGTSSYGVSGSTYPQPSPYPPATSSASTAYPPATSSSASTAYPPSTTSSASTPYPMPSVPAPSRRSRVDTTMSSAMTAPTRPAMDSTGQPQLLDPCGSPIGSDQSQCLTKAIAKADGGVTAVYQRLIDALRRQAGVIAGDPDPASVDDLRAAQHRWQQDREDACRSVGTGSFYAKERGACYADRAAERKSELQRQLDAIP